MVTKRTATEVAGMAHSSEMRSWAEWISRNPKTRRDVLRYEARRAKEAKRAGALRRKMASLRAAYQYRAALAVLQASLALDAFREQACHVSDRFVYLARDCARVEHGLRKHRRELYRLAQTKAGYERGYLLSLAANPERGTAARVRAAAVARVLRETALLSETPYVVQEKVLHITDGRTRTCQVRVNVPLELAVEMAGSLIQACEQDEVLRIRELRRQARDAGLPGARRGKRGAKGRGRKGRSRARSFNTSSKGDILAPKARAEREEHRSAFEQAVARELERLEREDAASVS